MRHRKGYFEISKQRKKGCVKMALDDLWKQEKEKDRIKGQKTNECEKYNLRGKYNCSMQFLSSFSRVRTAVPATNEGNKCSKSIPFLEDKEYKDNDIRKEDLNGSENIEKILKCSNKENKKVRADTTSQMISKVPSHDAKHHTSNSHVRMRKMKFEHMMNRKKYLLNKCKVERRNRESTNKELDTSNSMSEIIPASNKTNKTNRIQIPVQINREKLKITSEVRLFEKEVNNSRSSYYKFETMEADSTVSNDKKDNIDIDNDKNMNEQKDISQRELSATADKFQNNSNVPIVCNKNDQSKIERKRKRIKKRLRYCFDECLTISEEEEEESILDSCIYKYKRQKNDFNKTLNDSTNIESHTTVLDSDLCQTEIQGITTDLVMHENVTNNIIYTETSKSVQQVEAVSSIMNVVEYNNNKTVSDNDVLALQNKSPVDKNVHMEEATKSTLLDNDEEIQTNLSNELQIENGNYSSENHSLICENNGKEKYVEKSSSLKEFIDTRGDTLPDININSDNCNDTNMKVLTNYAIKIRTSSEDSSNNNNIDEITSHVPQNRYIKDSQLNTDSSDSGTLPEVLNSTLDSTSPTEEISEISKKTENNSKTLKDNVSINTKNVNDQNVEIQTKLRSHTKPSECSLQNVDISQQNITNSLPQLSKPCVENEGEDLNKLLQIDINANHKIQSDGNTISIQENHGKDINQHVRVKNVCIANVTDKTNEISTKHSVSNTEERPIEKSSTIETDNGLKDNINTCNEQNKDGTITPILSDKEANLSTDNNTVDNISSVVSDTSKQHAIIDCNTKNTDNFKQPETVQPSKIRVLSSAELGSRWCPTPVNNFTSVSVTESQLPCYPITKVTNDEGPCNDSSTSRESNFNIIPDNIQLPLSCIYNIMMRIRTIEKKYLLNNCQNVDTGNQKTIANDEQFKSNFRVLLQEFLNLKTEMNIPDINKAVTYGISLINKYYLTSHQEPLSAIELCRYMTACKSANLKSTAATPSNDGFVLNEQGTNSQGINSNSAHTSTTRPVPNVSSSPNVVPVTLSFAQNLYVPTVSQSHIAYNNLPKQNVYVPNVSNQNHEYNISHLQALRKSVSSIPYVSSMPPTYTNMHVSQENRTSNINMSYYQRLIQQQSIPVVAMNNVPNANIMQLKNNIHIAQRTNLYNKSQEGLIRNKSELIAGQSSMPQRMTQQTIPQVAQKTQGSQIYMAPNAQNAQISCSIPLSTHSSSVLSGINKLSFELIFKIWDQLTYCLENKFISFKFGECPLRSFYERWKQPLNTFIHQRMQSKQDDEFPIIPQSKEAKCMFYMYEQFLLNRKELQKQSQLVQILCKKKNLVSPVNVKLQNATETTLHKSRNYRKNVVPVCDTVLNVSDKNNSVLVGSNYTNFDNTLTFKNVTAATFTSSVNKTGKERNMPKTNGLSLLENSDIEVLEVVHAPKESSLPEQTTGKVVHMEKEYSLPKPTIEEVVQIAKVPEQTIREEIIHMEKESSVLEQTIEKVVPVEKECSLPEQTIEENVHMEVECSLPEQTIEKDIHMEKESSLPEQTIEEDIHIEKESTLLEQTTLPEQTIEEVAHMEKENSLTECTIEEGAHMEKECSLPEQIIEEVVQMEKECLLPEQTSREEIVHEKEHSSLIGQIIRDNTNYLQCDSIQSVTSSDPHIVDVRSISPTLFNKMENVFALNNSQLSSSKSTENNEIKVKIEIPEEIFRCFQCSKASTVICEVCLEAHYCSRECAELYWVSEHHKYCKPSSLRFSGQCDNDTLMTEDTDFDLSNTNVP